MATQTCDYPPGCEATASHVDWVNQSRYRRIYYLALVAAGVPVEWAQATKMSPPSRTLESVGYYRIYSCETHTVTSTAWVAPGVEQLSPERQTEVVRALGLSWYPKLLQNMVTR